MAGFTIKLKKGEKGLEPISPLMSNLYKEYIKSLEKDQVVEVVFTILTKEGTNAQLKKIHAMIRDISTDTGQDFEEVKLYIKQKAGFVMFSDKDVEIKSFADMTRDELSSCIQAATNLADHLGLNI